MAQASTQDDDLAAASLNRRLGDCIRREREGHGWSLSELAERAGVSRAMIHKLEHGGASPTAALLSRLADALGVAMSELIARVERQEGRLARRADQPERTDPSTGLRRRRLSPKSDLPIDLFEVELPPGGELAMPTEDLLTRRQLVLVTAGALSVTDGGKAYQLETGDCLKLGPPADCLFRNDGSEPAVIIVTVLNSR
jgi:transcriptional regulator with XRE-family HTH domain